MKYRRLESFDIQVYLYDILMDDGSVCLRLTSWSGKGYIAFVGFRIASFR